MNRFEDGQADSTAREMGRNHTDKSFVREQAADLGGVEEGDFALADPYHPPAHR